MAKRWIPPLVGERVRLRLLAEADLPMTLAWRNQDHIRKWFLNSNRIVPEEHREWFAQHAERDDDFVFIIEEHHRLHKPVGQTSLYRIDWKQKRAEYGRLLIGEPEATGQGLAREATEVLLRYAAELGLRDIELEVLAHNDVAIALYRACGFCLLEERDGQKRMRKQLSAGGDD